LDKILTNKGYFYLETYGCASNKADSYIISDLLVKSNYIQSDIENAEFIIINTCAVKEQTENKIKTRLKKLNERYGLTKNIVIAGCLPHIASNYINVIKGIVPNFAAIIDPNNIIDVSSIIDRISIGEKNIIACSKKEIDKAKFFVKHHSEKITGIVPISEGCLGSCAYCCVKNARGKLKCFDPQYIVENIENQLSQGIKQIYLTSQDCSIYRYKAIELKELINKVITLDYKFFLRIGMINPSFLVNNFEQLYSIFDFNKVYRFLHIPIQSGSNHILKKMQRAYLISQIAEKVEILRKKSPMFTISTDIICGFPGETEYDFHRTINFIKWLQPEILNISKFTARPGTEAKKMKQVESRTIKQRSIRLSNVYRNSLSRINAKWKDWEGEVLVLHEGSEENQGFGRNIAYKNVFINDYQGKLGEFVRVRIKEVEGYNLFGVIL
jgi:MiaB-like tRNA modifying enzyme